MRGRLKSIVAGLLFAQVLCAFSIDQPAAESSSASGAGGKSARKGASRTHATAQRMLTPDDGLAIISAALDTQRHFASNRDCSHLIHAIYERAGFPYEYVSSDDLYDGVSSFRRVFHPQTGDLIVWQGHVGIVVRPSHHVFFSFLQKGPKTDNYRSAYWISRGEARFYRYLKK
jgi:cell wall-associated NlpC family hydrolase